jgi:hypothetical protein
MPGAGYDIGASNAEATNQDPFEEAATNFIFGNENNPSATASQTATADATATTKSPGATTVTGQPSDAATDPVAAAFSGLSTTDYILLAIAGLLAIFVLKHHE